MESNQVLYFLHHLRANHNHAIYYKMDIQIEKGVYVVFLRFIFVLCIIMYTLFGDPIFIAAGLLSLIIFLVDYMDGATEVGDDE